MASSAYWLATVSTSPATMASANTLSLAAITSVTAAASIAGSVSEACSVAGSCWQASAMPTDHSNTTLRFKAPVMGYLLDGVEGAAGLPHPFLLPCLRPSVKRESRSLHPPTLRRDDSSATDRRARNVRPTLG